MGGTKVHSKDPFGIHTRVLHDSMRTMNTINLTRKAAGELAKLGFTILPGGGQGLTEAASVRSVYLLNALN